MDYHRVTYLSVTPKSCTPTTDYSPRPINQTCRASRGTAVYECGGFGGMDDTDEVVTQKKWVFTIEGRLGLQRGPDISAISHYCLLTHTTLATTIFSLPLAPSDEEGQHTTRPGANKIGLESVFLPPLWLPTRGVLAGGNFSHRLILLKNPATTSHARMVCSILAPPPGREGGEQKELL